VRRALLAAAASLSVVVGLGAAGFGWLVVRERDGLDCFDQLMSVAVDGTGRDGAATPRAALLQTEWWTRLQLPQQARNFSAGSDPEFGITVADDDPSTAHSRDGGQDFFVHIDGRSLVQFSVERGLDGTYAVGGLTSCYEPLAAR
jgi:hypothetical protein